MRRTTLIVAGLVLAGALALVLVIGPRTIGLLVRSPRAGFERIARAEERSAGVELEAVARGFPQTTDVQFVPGSARRAVVLEKTGRARVVTLAPSGESRVVEGKDSPVLFEVPVQTASELGLLGLAFHPKFSQNGLFYVNYNPEEGETRTRVAEWHVPPARLGQVRATERRVLLEVAQPYVNHDGGGLAFGPDGMLYIGLGDGGAANDPHGHGQNLGTLLGSMLRIDPDRRDPGKEYAVPKDNPFVGRKGARPEIWAYGLRNPWRYSFDPKGRLIAGDVGQVSWEEIDLVERGKNLGWNTREGAHCFSPPTGCATQGLVDPLFDYDRSLGISVTGGYVYLGKRLPELKGQYVFGDFGTGRLWALEVPDAPRRVQARPLGRWRYAFSTFGRDADGELYAADFGPGTLYRLVRKR